MSEPINSNRNQNESRNRKYLKKIHIVEFLDRIQRKHYPLPQMMMMGSILLQHTQYTPRNSFFTINSKSKQTLGTELSKRQMR